MAFFSRYGTEGQEFESLAARQQRTQGCPLAFFVLGSCERDENVVRPSHDGQTLTDEDSVA